MNTLDPESCFQLQVARDQNGKGRILVGFDKPAYNANIVSIRGINTVFVGKSKEILINAGVDWDDRGNVLIYPRIDLETQETPNPSIMAFNTNKILLSKESEIKYGAWERGEKVKMPMFIVNLFKYKFIQSVYLTENIIQIELKKSTHWKDHEEKIADIIIDYLETLPEPILLLRRD
ncbi:MAG: NifU N-terminal domain-containing protein [Leptospira sp.]|nr:NifU N-terminal domain-containing protein [Leptospira sp.]